MRVLLCLLLASSTAIVGPSAVGATEPALAQSLDSQTVPEPADYRLSDYRAPVPGTLRGATVIDTKTAEDLFEAKVPFVDVLPRAPKPKGLPPGTIWRPKPRNNIPGSLWLVDTGYGELAPVMETYFLDGLAKVTGGDKKRPLVIYCQRDCWMSYNAAKRAVRAGYTAVNWYPDGTDGWGEAGNPLAPSEPFNRPDE